MASNDMRASRHRSDGRQLVVDVMKQTRDIEDRNSTRRVFLTERSVVTWRPDSLSSRPIIWQSHRAKQNRTPAPSASAIFSFSFSLPILPSFTHVKSIRKLRIGSSGLRVVSSMSLEPLVHVNDHIYAFFAAFPGGDEPEVGW